MMNVLNIERVMWIFFALCSYCYGVLLGIAIGKSKGEKK